ncbi:MAG: tetratricopeptide repeat protein [Deltaproteobacteria bacterium]|nr:tetratricopeptide repeat protein [Deltaproteobacteria bacterium]
MPEKKKVSRKKLLKEPDEFISTTAKVIGFLKEHRRKLALYGVVALVIAAAAVGVQTYFRWQEEKAQAIQQQALLLYQQAAGRSQEAGAEKEFREALKKFQEALAAYHRGITAQISRIYLGHCHYALKEYDPAIQAYAQAVSGPLRAMALEGLGYAHEAKGDTRKALEYFEQNLTAKSSPYQLADLLNVGRCYERLGQKGKALEAYQKALARSPKSQLADFVQMKIGELKG